MKGIKLNNDSEITSIPQLSDQFLKGILEDDSFYIYGNAIVEPITDPQSGCGRLKTLALPDLKWYLRRVFCDRSEADIRAVAEDILHTPELPLRRINGLVSTPTFREDLTLVTAPGFDPTSGLYYAPDPSLRSFTFSTDATRAKAEESLDLILELLTDFPFRRPGESYTYISALLTLFLRSSIRSVVPGLAIDGNGQSVGKGLLSSMLSWIVYGQDAASMSVPKDRAEWGSKIDSIVLDGKPFQVIDNITESFANDDFASTLTSTRRNIRIKGLSKVVDVPVNTVWILNGNGISFDSDMAQRLIMCRLEHEDAPSRPQEKFHIQKTYHCSIETLLRRDRAKYMQACLDIICAWVNDGAPRRQKLVMAKYGAWESVVGGILDWARPEARFLGEHLKDTLALDTEKDETITFLRQLMLEFPKCDKEFVSVSEVAERVFPKEGRSTLRDFVPNGLIGGDKNFARCLGRWLKNASTRTWGTLELIAEKDSHSNVWKYLIGANIKKVRAFNVQFEASTKTAP